MSSSPPPSPNTRSGGIKQHLPFVAALALGLVLGGASGALVVGPAMAKGIAPAGAPVAHARVADPAEEGEGAEHAEDAESEEGTEPEEGEEGAEKDGAKGGEKPVYTLDNLVLNPAESGGTRFLLLTIAFEAKNAATVEAMRARDAELRDAVLVTIGTKTVEHLADMAQREALKVELKAATAKLFKKGAVRRIYFPQFVIQ